MVSPCCGAPIQPNWGSWLCSMCWQPVTAPKPQATLPKQRDLIAWLFPAEKGERPKGQHVFIRQGRSIRWTDRPRGRVNGWFWDGA